MVKSISPWVYLFPTFSVFGIILFLQTNDQLSIDIENEKNETEELNFQIDILYQKLEVIDSQLKIVKGDSNMKKLLISKKKLNNQIK